MLQEVFPPGLQLKIERIRLGLRQFELAAQAGIHPSRLSLIESGRVTPHPDELMRLREVLAHAAGRSE